MILFKPIQRVQRHKAQQTSAAFNEARRWVLYLSDPLKLFFWTQQTL